jgi:hypothetical protein
MLSKWIFGRVGMQCAYQKKGHFLPMLESQGGFKNIISKSRNMSYFVKTLISVACTLSMIGLAGCEQSAATKEEHRVEQNAQAQREAVDRNLQAQKDAAQKQKETITSREKTQENAIEQDAQARDRAANTQADDAHRNAAALQDQADQAKAQAEQADRRAKDVNR